MTVLAPPTGAPASTATGTGARNVAGRAIAITVFSTCRWWARPYLTALFWYSRLRPSSRAKLARLSFIHFARWTLIKRVPGRRLRYDHLFFESNFNGGWEEYIDAFSHILTKGMKKFWGSSYGFPGALPTAPFKAYIRQHEVEVSHYWSAYPHASTTMITAALALDARLDAFAAEAAGLWRRGAGGGLVAAADGGAGMAVNLHPDRSGQATAFTSLVPVAPGREPALRAGSRPTRRRRARSRRCRGRTSGAG